MFTSRRLLGGQVSSNNMVARMFLCANISACLAQAGACAQQGNADCLAIITSSLAHRDSHCALAMQAFQANHRPSKQSTCAQQQSASPHLCDSSGRRLPHTSSSSSLTPRPPLSAHTRVSQAQLVL